MTDWTMTRRQLLAVLASTTLSPLVAGCRGEQAAGAPAGAPEADAIALLDDIGNNLLRLMPETATSLGLDTGDRAELRGQLTDRSAEGQQRIAGQLRSDLDRASALDVSGLTPQVRTSIEVVRSAYATALEGFALPYGDITVGADSRVGGGILIEKSKGWSFGSTQHVPTVVIGLEAVYGRSADEKLFGA